MISSKRNALYSSHAASTVTDLTEVRRATGRSEVLASNAHNFSAGPGALPEAVLQQLSDELLQVPDQRLSLLGISHRSSWFSAVVEEVEQRLRNLLGLDNDWHVLLLQGGSSLQFSMIPMNFLAADASADYLRTGYWSRKSLLDPGLYGSVRLAWDGETFGFRCLPGTKDLNLDPKAAYFHYVSNETVEGLQFHDVPGLEGVPRVCDMSSDFLSRPIPVDRYDLIYAHAQKNLGPAGLTIVLLRQSFLDRKLRTVPAMLDYRNHRDEHSIYNTPPTFSIYATLLVLRWLEEDVAGLEAMAARNRRKAEQIYRAIDDSSGFYQGHVEPSSRSLMNVSFRLPSQELEQRFLCEASQAGLEGLAGHRSIGGLRASLYNAVTEQSCEQLASFMSNFYRNIAGSADDVRKP
jgi:phosphoserine aminotransferase